MVSAPVGYVLDSTERTVNVTYQDQKIEEWNLPTENYTLVRQDYDLDVTKVFSGLNFYKQKVSEDGKVEAIALDEGAYADVIVGIYASEDIKNVYGNIIIAKDTLVDVVIFDEDGKGTFASAYPLGKFYAKEIATNINYVLSNEKYEFETKPTNNKDARFDVSVGEIVNEASKENKLNLTKIEEVVYEDETQPSMLQSLLSKLESFAEGVLEGLLTDVEKTTPVTRLSGAKYVVYYLGEDGQYYKLLEKAAEIYQENN